MKKIALVLALTLVGTTAMAQQKVCGEREKFVDHLAGSTYKESPAAIGLVSNGQVLEVLTNIKKGNWTIIVTRTDGYSCVVASGESWEFISQADREILALKDLPQY